MGFNKNEMIEKLPSHMQEKIQKLDFFKEDGKSLELVLATIVRTYNSLIQYKQHGLIKYYEIGGQQYYDPEDFNKNRDKLKAKFEEIREFLYCSTKPPMWGANPYTGKAYLLSEDEIDEHTKNDKIKFSISNPNDIIKDLEATLTHTGAETTRKILYIVTGLKRLTRKNEIERALGMPIPIISLNKD